jgi:hypothetical protein
MRTLLLVPLLAGAALTRPGDPVPPRRATPLPVVRPVVSPVVHPVVHPVVRSGARPARRPSAARAPLAAAAMGPVLTQYCGKCHNNTSRRGNLSLAGYDALRAPEAAEVSEKIVTKLRLGMMPPAGSARPKGDTLDAIAALLEQQLDSAAAVRPDPGYRTFQRLNRAEYRASVLALLGLEVDAANYLPPDTKSDGFDNIADAQALSPMLLDAYLRAASDLSWLAVGNRAAAAASVTWTVPKLTSQMEHVPGTPYGTRGGIAVTHTFPADGDYRLDANFFHETTGAFAGGLARGERLELSVDGERVALLEVDRFMTAADPNGVAMSSEPVRISAGTHRLAAAFVPPGFQAVSQELVSPLRYSLSSTSNATAYGFQQLPHLREFTVRGPLAVTGVSETATRRRIFRCRPADASGASAEARTCARAIITRLGTEAYRRALTPGDVEGLLALYEGGRAGTGGFEGGVRAALEGILASPDFVFRFERAPADARPGVAYRLRDEELAVRLAFFLWSAPPDAALREAAARGRLATPAGLEREVRRLLADPRASSLATRFAAQWLRLPDLAQVQPDIRQYTAFDEQLRGAMQRETELFFDDLVRRDQSALELFRADYTFVNEQLARHYGIPGVAGPQFRRVRYPDSTRGGILGHASVLTLTSHATRTSAVERGKWVMEVLLHSPPPPPPPGVPDLEATPGAADGRLLTVRERMAAHRANPTCASCHRMIDPIGLALEGFDVTGRVRVRDNGMPIDARTELWDGTPAAGLPALRAALLRRQESLLRTFTQNLMAYALGRRVEAADMPAVRAIVRDAGAQQHRMSAYILGVVRTPAFRMQRPPEPVAASSDR